MHIPDGYLGPSSWTSLWAVCLVLWGIASRRVRQTLDTRRIPLVATSAAFSFVIMMFNIPIPGGTTGHAVGGVLIALAIGPWAASIAISIALVIQALIFGDGGMTAIGANCVNIAFAMPFAGYGAFVALRRILPSSDRWTSINAGVAGWVGLNASALLTAAQFGVQPLLHVGPDGRPLYAPYPMSVAIPVMALEHMLLFGVIEGIVTGLAVRALLRSESAWIIRGDSRGGDR